MAIFALSIMLSSFLLFQVQPLIGKYILPWFGGTTSVWSASLLFFQSLLTGGYAYTYWLTGRLSARRQKLVHLGLLGFSLVILLVSGILWDAPILPGDSWQPPNDMVPLLAVMRVLFSAVGVPFFVLATNSTLMQAWFVQKFPHRSPYWLYAVSNAASLLGLLTYPFLVEPLFKLKSQAILWTALFLFFALITATQAWKLARTYGGPLDSSPPPADLDGIPALNHPNMGPG